MTRASQTPEFHETAKRFHVSTSLLALYLGTMVGYSNTAGKAVFPSRTAVAGKLCRSVRQTARCRQAAIALGFEETAGRYFKRDDDVVRRTSNVSRMNVPTLFLPKPMAARRRQPQPPAAPSPDAIAADKALDAYLAPGGHAARVEERMVPAPPTPQVNETQDPEPKQRYRRTMTRTTKEALKEARNALGDRSPP